MDVHHFQFLRPVIVETVGRARRHNNNVTSLCSETFLAEDELRRAAPNDKCFRIGMPVQLWALLVWSQQCEDDCRF